MTTLRTAVRLPVEDGLDDLGLEVTDIQMTGEGLGEGEWS